MLHIFILLFLFFEAAPIIPTDAADILKTRETYRKASLDAKLFLLTDTHKEKAENHATGVLQCFLA
jgi:hypothetical protein